MIALSVILMFSGHTSVQHLVMLHIPRPAAPWASWRRSWVSSGCMSSSAYRRKNRGPAKAGLFSLVVAHDVAGVLAQEALDALAELLAALGVHLRHPALPVRVPRRRGEGGSSLAFS